jgi:hypothetical protein
VKDGGRKVNLLISCAAVKVAGNKHPVLPIMRLAHNLQAVDIANFHLHFFHQRPFSVNRLGSLYEKKTVV